MYETAEMQRPAANLASSHRVQGIPADIDLSGKPLKKQIESATTLKYAIIVGPKEFESNQVVLRNMQDRTEKLVPLDELVSDA